jgi:ATP-binding cassette subfamily F protein uup
LTYKEKRAFEAQKQELLDLPKKIEALEMEQVEISQTMTGPDFYQGNAAEIARTASRLHALEEELTRAYQRWQELENGEKS